MPTKFFIFVLSLFVLSSCVLPNSYYPQSYQEIPQGENPFVGTWGNYIFSMYEFYKFEEDGSFWEHSIFSKNEGDSLASLKKTKTIWQFNNDKTQVLVTGNTGFEDGTKPPFSIKREMIFKLSKDGKTLSYTDNKGGRGSLKRY